jgi:hypothetical protein
MILRKVAVTGFGAIGLAAFAISANAALVTNGSFETNGGGGQIGASPGTTTASGWSVQTPPASYFFLFTSGSQATGTGVTGEYGNLKLFPTIGASPDGGAFIGSDPGFQNTAITQTISGLTAGTMYTVSFDYAGAQQVGFTGATQEGWAVSLGSETHDTALLSNASQSFTGWTATSLTFTASTTGSEVLSFLAIGTPSQAAPPFTLLDGVSMTPVTGTPEPASWTMLVGGLGLLGCARFTHAKNWFKR